MISIGTLKCAHVLTCAPMHARMVTYQYTGTTAASGIPTTTYLDGGCLVLAVGIWQYKYIPGYVGVCVRSNVFKPGTTDPDLPVYRIRSSTTRYLIPFCPEI